MRRFWPWFCALLSGILLALCFAPANLGGLSWFALTPLICAAWFGEEWSGRKETLRLLGLGYVAGLGYFLGSLHWLITVTVPGWIALCLYISIYPALWTLFIGLVVKPRQSPFEAKPVWMKSGNNLVVASLGAAAWVATEWLRGVVFTGFGWNSLGIALHENVALIQITDITGVGGVSFMLVMVNLMIVITVKRLMTELGKHRLRPHYDFSLTVAVVALVFGYGARQIFEPTVSSEQLRIAAVQGNIPVREKRDQQNAQRILDLHTRLSETALAMKIDLLIWPEAATPGPLLSDQQSWDAVRSITEKHTGDFLLGTTHFDNTGDYNSAILLTDKAARYQLYHKMHLVPFGEYVPLRNAFPLFAWVVGDLVPDDFDAGRENTVLQMVSKPIKIAPLICFEDTLGNLARKFAREGAQLFVNVTNDGWFLKSAGSRQHLAHAIFRCAETKLPMVRAANTGVSCTIDRFGVIGNRLQNVDGDTFIEGVLFAEINVPKNPQKTFFTLNGELFSLVCLGITAVMSGLAVRRLKS